MNKADYINLINTKLPDAGNIPSSDHRATMHTDPNSVAELVYGDKLGDDNVSQIYTTSNSNFNYQIDIFKNGNTITLSGQIASLVNTSENSLSKIFDFSNTDFQGSGVGIARGTINNTNVITIQATSTGIFTNGAILNGQIYNFSITYNANN